MSALDIATRRIYEPAAADDGTRVLIMRLWPRGIRKDRVSVWLKELGPVPTLLRAFLDGRITWAQYVPQYRRGERVTFRARRRRRKGRLTGRATTPVDATL